MRCGFGAAGFEVLAVHDDRWELTVEVETTATVVGCAGCGTRARPKDRRWVTVRDAPAGDRPCWCAGASGSGVARSRSGGIVKTCGSGSRVDHAASFRFWLLRWMITPFSKRAPARTRATRCGPLTARHRSVELLASSLL